MNHSRNISLKFWAGIIGICLFLVVFSLFRLNTKRVSAETAAYTYQDCHVLSQKILKAQQQPQIAKSKEAVERQEVNLLIEEAMSDVGLKPASLESIRPSPPRRSESNPVYLEIETHVQFGPLPTEQLVRMLYLLVELDPSIEVSQILLATPARKPSDYRVDRWMTQIVLTQLIFDPITASSRNGSN